MTPDYLLGEDTAILRSDAPAVRQSDILMTEAQRDSLEELFEQAPCGYIFTTPDGTFIRANRLFLEWTGYERDELVGSRRFQDLLTTPSRIFFENQYVPLIRLQGQVKEVAFDLVRRGREPLPVLVNSVMRADAAGKPLLIASTIFDASDRRAYERELLLARRNAEQLAAVVATSDDAIVSASPAGEIQGWNAGAERMFGYPAREMTGRSVATILLPEDFEAIWNQSLHELRMGRNVHLDTAGMHADGRSLDISIGLTPHIGPLGELIAVSAIIRDIGQRRVLERLQQEFLAMATHELRNPVAGIKAHAQLMRRRGTYSEGSVNSIVAQADRLTRLIDDLMLASQIEAARLELRLEELDLAAEARTAVDDLGAAASAIRVDAPVQVAVMADRQRLGQVFANLLTNAIKYSPGGGEIAVRVWFDQGDARAAVSDRGSGIPADALPHLFERFYRVAETTERVQGLGLGLYISQSIARAHRGRIEVESELGRGSTFTLVLPVATSRS